MTETDTDERSAVDSDGDAYARSLLRVPLLWVHFMRADTRCTSQSAAPGVADDGSTRIYLETIGGVACVRIEDPSQPVAHVPVTNVASFALKA